MSPERLTALVPACSPRPSDWYQSAPCFTMGGAAEKVSTLLTTVGKSSKPWVTGKGGRLRGNGCLPSRLLSNEPSSPQMYAPAPRRISPVSWLVFPVSWRVSWPPSCLRNPRPPLLRATAYGLLQVSFAKKGLIFQQKLRL